MFVVCIQNAAIILILGRSCMQTLFLHFPGASAYRLTTRYSSSIVTYWWFAVTLVFGKFDARHKGLTNEVELLTYTSQLKTRRRRPKCAEANWQMLQPQCLKSCANTRGSIMHMRAFLCNHCIFWSTNRAVSAVSSCVNTELILEWTVACENSQVGLKQAVFSLDFDEYRHEACLGWWGTAADGSVCSCFLCCVLNQK